MSTKWNLKEVIVDWAISCAQADDSADPAGDALDILRRNYQHCPELSIEVDDETEYLVKIRLGQKNS